MIRLSLMSVVFICVISMVFAEAKRLGDAFDGDKDYAEIKNEYDMLSELTVSFWIWQPDSAKKAMHIVGNNRGHDIENPGFGFLKSKSDRGNGFLEFRVSDGGKMIVAYTNRLPAGKWAHVTGVFKGGDYADLYINGELVHHQINDTDAPGFSFMKPEVKTTGVSKSPVRIGINMEGEKSLNGMKLDRLQIQNVALSEDEVKALYNLKFP